LSPSGQTFCEIGVDGVVRCRLRPNVRPSMPATVGRLNGFDTHADRRLALDSPLQKLDAGNNSSYYRST
jgi:hypothetical protein